MLSAVVKTAPRRGENAAKTRRWNVASVAGASIESRLRAALPVKIKIPGQCSQANREISRKLELSTATNSSSEIDGMIPARKVIARGAWRKGNDNNVAWKDTKINNNNIVPYVRARALSARSVTNDRDLSSAAFIAINLRLGFGRILL